MRKRSSGSCAPHILPRFGDGLADDVAGVERRFRLDQDGVNLSLSHRQVIDTARDDHEFSRADTNLAVAQLYS